MPPDFTSWLESNEAAATGESIGRYAARLAASIVVGIVIAHSYRASTRLRSEGEVSRLAKTLVMLTVLVAMTALVVDNSVARAFSLVGAGLIVLLSLSGAVVWAARGQPPPEAEAT